MWNDFSDFELAELAARYGLEEELVFCNNLSLANRTHIEARLSEVEYDMVYGE